MNETERPKVEWREWDSLFMDHATMEAYDCEEMAHNINVILGKLNALTSERDEAVRELQEGVRLASRSFSDPRGMNVNQAPSPRDWRVWMTGARHVINSLATGKAAQGRTGKETE